MGWSRDSMMVKLGQRALALSRVVHGRVKCCCSTNLETSLSCEKGGGPRIGWTGGEQVAVRGLESLLGVRGP